MKTYEAFGYGWKNLRRRKLRSWLTILGVIIGIMTVMVVMSIGEGVKASISKELESFGSDQMFILPIAINAKSMASFSGGRGATNGKLFEKDYNAINGVAGVKEVSKLVYGRTTVAFKDKEITATVYGVDTVYFDIWQSQFKIEKGRILQSSDKSSVVLGYSAAYDLFGKNEVGVGSVLIIGKKKFHVVGIMEKIGTTFSQADDSSIYVSFDDGAELFKSQLSKDEISFISVKIGQGFDSKKIQEDIEFRIASLHKVSLDDKDFSVITADFVNETIGSLLGALSTFLFAITLISSIVGGIGISNTMFMAVLERIKEIGILKSVGATNSDIMKIFLIESGLMGLMGGLVGIVFGVLLLLLVGNFGIPYVITPTLILFSILFSFMVGIISGYIPARRASNMLPVEAFRHE
ncbi:MAG: ABC transporter permease [Candidatus Micrarchaeota archaeon]